MISNVYNPQALNRYSFEENNPVNRVDPDGHVAWVAVGAGVGSLIGVGMYIHNNGGLNSLSSNWGGALEAGASGALMGVAITSGYAEVAGLATAGSAFIDRHLSGKSLFSVDAAFDVVGSGFLGYGAAKLLPNPRIDKIKYLDRFLITKTGREFLAYTTMGQGLSIMGSSYINEIRNFLTNNNPSNPSDSSSNNQQSSDGGSGSSYHGGPLTVVGVDVDPQYISPNGGIIPGTSPTHW